MPDSGTKASAAPIDEPAHGYVGDVPYVRHYIREMTPAWLDFVALLWGFAPPDRGEGFTWCDMGCGQGINVAVLAATHPGGRFHGVDMMPDHVASARGLAAAAGLDNAHFHAADFAAAAQLNLPQFDYVTAHGVYSWIDAKARAALLHFVDRRLKPGGIFYVSYNALPGRAADLPLQRLVRGLGGSVAGDSAARTAAALAMVRRLLDMKVPALAASPMGKYLTGRKSRWPASYLAHEFMVDNWEPQGVMEVRAAARAIGLVPAGAAHLLDNFDHFVLGKKARRLLAGIADEDLRESVRDYFINQPFRRDVFIRGGTRLATRDRRRRVLDTVFALPRPARKIDFQLATAAGRVNFDNAAARHIIASLSAGPRRLRDAAAPGIARDDLMANAMILCSADHIMPVEAAVTDPARLNEAILDRVGGPEEIGFIALPCGTAVPIRPEVLARLRNGGKARRRDAGWRRFLASHGVVPASGPAAP